MLDNALCLIPPQYAADRRTWSAEEVNSADILADLLSPININQ
jgi:hypothetical protein